VVFIVTPVSLTSFYVDVLVNEPGVSVVLCLDGFNGSKGFLVDSIIKRGCHNAPGWGTMGLNHSRTPSRLRENYWGREILDSPHVQQNRKTLPQDPQNRCLSRPQRV